MPARPWSATASGVVIAVRLTPKGGRDSIDGIEALSDGRNVLKARVRALPSEGEANAALLKLIARTLDVPTRSVALGSGATSRVKRITVEGDSAALIARLEKFVSPR
jgi:uncharacterized protein (TIGR00251 family)